MEAIKNWEAQLRSAAEVAAADRADAVAAACAAESAIMAAEAAEAARDRPRNFCSALRDCFSISHRH